MLTTTPRCKKSLICLFQTTNLRQGYLDQVRLFSEAPESFDAFEPDTTGFSDFDNTEPESIEDLRQVVTSLKTQVKYLKKMVFLNVFDSKEDFKDFFSDIW